jgi:hypothetical protein
MNLVIENLKQEDAEMLSALLKRMRVKFTWVEPAAASAAPTRQKLSSTKLQEVGEAKTVGNFLKAFEHVVDEEFAQDVEDAMKQWKNIQPESW